MRDPRPGAIASAPVPATKINASVASPPDDGPTGRRAPRRPSVERDSHPEHRTASRSVPHRSGRPQDRMNTTETKVVLEAALLTATEPLGMPALRRLFDDALDAETIRGLLGDLAGDWTDRGLALTPIASGWRFQTRASMRMYLGRLNPERPQRYSRAVMETLAIIAYRQPVTRGDIEDIRGVTVSTPVIKSLEERGWIDAIGHREAPGRPALYATTRTFLDDLGLTALSELPPLPQPGEPDSAGPLLQEVIDFAQTPPPLAPPSPA